MPKIINRKYKEPEWGDVILKLEKDETFKIGQIYDDDAATTISCKKCGCVEFNVGCGSHYTAISCPKCGWQLCIHDG